MKRIIWLLLCASGVAVQAARLEENFYDAQEELYEYGICPICLDEKLLNARTNCGHSFCNECIEICIETRNAHPRCPLCRADITTISGQPLVVRQTPRRYVFIPRNLDGNALLNPQNHEFVYNNSRILVVSGYRRDVVNFIRSLTPAEYTAIMQRPEFRNRGSLETLIGGSTIYGDADFLPLEDRRALLLERFSLPMRPEYRRPWIPLWIKFETTMRRELQQRQRERSINNVRARENMRRWQGL